MAARPSLTPTFTAVIDWPFFEAVGKVLHSHDVNARDLFGYSLLDAAIINGGELSLIRALLDHGADVHNVAKDSGKSAVHHAVRKGNPKILHLLVRAGADIAAVDKQGNTAWLSDMGWRDAAMVKCLLHLGCPLHQANHAGRTGWDELQEHPNLLEAWAKHQAPVAHKQLSATVPKADPETASRPKRRF